MSWSLDSDRPIFQQIVEHIQMQILSGKYAPGDKVPSVRDLAMEAAVNPNTMQKALSELERKGLVYTQRTSGRFITEDQEMIGRLKEEKANEAIETFFRCMEQIGYGKREAAAVLSRRSAAVSEAAGAGVAAAAQDGGKPAPDAQAARQEENGPAADDPAISEERKQG